MSSPRGIVSSLCSSRTHRMVISACSSSKKNIDEDFLESPVDDSDNDKDYKLPSGSSSSSESDGNNSAGAKSVKRKVKRKSDMPSGNIHSDIGNENEEFGINEMGNLSNEIPERDIGDLVNDTVQGENNNEEGGEQNTGELKITRKRPIGMEKIDRDKNKHPMRAVCGGKCRRLCNRLTEDNRHNIWNQYWNLDYTSRRKWLSKHLTLVPVKRRTVSAQHSRSDSRHFTLPLPDYTEIAVCRLTFLNTLGYTTDSVITELVTAIKSGPCGDQVKERRGGSHRPEADRDITKNHIESFRPCVSHYRRKNAPNVRYLPRELTIKIMYNDFVLKHPNICNLEVYRQVLKKMNISLRQPKSDVCEDNDISQNKFDIHRAKAAKANLEYKKNADEAPNGSKRIYSMDLQKVIILPVMPQSKSAFFTSRLVVFNQTFATLSKDHSNKSYSVLWHEALGGRKAEALVDAMFKVIDKERDSTEFVFWADNCTAQNKNWVLYTSLVTEVNRVSGPNKIVIRYLTKGHTHMSADGIHGNIEQKFLRKRNIYDFKELIETIESSRTKLEVLELNQFHLWPNKKRCARKQEDPLKTFLLSELVEVCFTKGNQYMQYKTDFADEYKGLDFIQKKHNPMTFTPQTLPTRGISASKKAKILKDLVPLMPTNRRVFWETMPESETSMDLVSAEQEVEEV